MKQRSGFTVLEMLIAIAVLAVVGLLIVRIISATSSATQMSTRGIVAASQARLAFDRIGLDLATLVHRRDVDFQAKGSFTAGPPWSMLFLSELTSSGVATSSNRGVSLVAYQIGTTADNPRPCLLRAGKAISWTDAGLLGYQTNSLPVSLSSVPVSLAQTDFDVLAPAVIRVVVGFQLAPTGALVTLANGSVAGASGQIVYSPPVLPDANGNPSAQLDRSQISSLIVGVVAGSPDNIALLDAGQVQLLANSFPTPADGELPVSKWASIADNANTLPATVPLPVRQSLRAFQRAFPLNPPGALNP